MLSNSRDSRVRGLVAISNGAACSSQTYTCSHVLSAMQLFEDPTPWGDRLIAGCRAE